MTALARTLVPLALILAAGVAEARRLPGPTLNDGPNCHALHRATGISTLYVGTVLGGQNRRGRWGDGTFRDYRSYQGCFVSADACGRFVARHQAHHPLPPGYGRCTPVFVGLHPAR